MGRVSIWVLAWLLNSGSVSRYGQVCLRLHSRHSFVASALSLSNFEPQLQFSFITHPARLCRLPLLFLVVGR